MAQFTENGPDIPDELLQAFEEDRLVFFCGAGISYNLGFKDFGWLVDEVKKRFSVDGKVDGDNTFDVVFPPVDNNFRIYSVLCFSEARTRQFEIF